jgi:hypothetical protein
MTVGEQARDADAIRPACLREIARDDDLTVRLKGHGADPIIGHRRVKRCIHRTGGAEGGRAKTQQRRQEQTG